MFKVGLKGLFAHKRRLFGICSAVIIGVAFLSGTLVLGDTMRAGFATVFGQANENVDVVVRASAAEETQGFAVRGNVDLSWQPTIEAVEGVAEVQPEVTGLAQITGADGEPIGGAGPPTLGGGWIDSVTNPYQIDEGRAPTTENEVVIDRGAATTGKLTIGDTATVRVPDPIEVTIVGIVTFGTADSIGGVTFTGFTFERAQQLFIGNTGQVSDFVVRGDDGVTQVALADRLRSALPAGVETITAEDLTAEQQSDINASFLDAFDLFLKIFSGIALVVAAFSIYNSFAVILAQRTRESALLRAIGASRAQVLRSMTFEALFIGVVSSIVGLVGGLFLATMMKAGLDAANFGLPKGGITIELDSVLIAVVVGIVVTLLAGVIPSIRASGVAPIAALRDVSIDRTTATAVRIGVGALLAALGISLVLSGALLDSSGALGRVALGTLLCLAAMLVLGPAAAKPGASAIGWPVATARGLPGGLARENAMRNPKRTASTSAALLVGITIVTLATLFASSLKTSFEDLIGENFSGDLVITSMSFGAPGFPPELVTEAAALPEVDQAAGWTFGIATVDGKGLPFVVSEPGPYGSIIDPNLTAGSISDLQVDQMAVSQELATQRGWAMGQIVPVDYLDGTTGTLTIAGIFTRPELVGADAFVPLETWAPRSPGPLSDREMFVTLNEGVTIEEGKAAIQPLADKFGTPDVMDRQEYIDLFSSSLDIFLIVVYFLLGLSILIAVLGISNTLALSIYERTRELGLLRAVGETRSQLRSMVRWESAIIAVFGTFGGLILGTFLGWGFMHAFATDEGFGTFTAPVGQLILILVVGGLFGMLAGVLPARRAAKLDILQSIAAEG